VCEKEQLICQQSKGNSAFVVIW